MIADDVAELYAALTELGTNVWIDGGAGASMPFFVSRRALTQTWKSWPTNGISQHCEPYWRVVITKMLSKTTHRRGTSFWLT